jgi:hypothetical protein
MRPPPLFPDDLKTGITESYGLVPPGIDGINRVDKGSLVHGGEFHEEGSCVSMNYRPQK